MTNCFLIGTTTHKNNVAYSLEAGIRLRNLYLKMCVKPLLWIVCLLLPRITTETDYCKLCKEKGSHTMCKYKAGVKSPCKIQPEERQKILDVHNSKRNFIAVGKGVGKGNEKLPEAADMKSLSWDKELAEIALRWIQQCEDFAHDECRNSERFYVGQNLAMKAPRSEKVVKESIEMWFNEIKDFEVQYISPYKSHGGTGHFTQMVWANTSLIGCARAYAEDSGQDSERLYCNYGPGGNTLGADMYKKGKARSACATGFTKTDSKYPGLCSSTSGLKYECYKSLINQEILILFLLYCTVL